MKKFISFLLLVSIALTSLTITTSAAIKGDGTEENPFIITTEEEMVLLSDFSDCYFELGNNITLTNDWIANDFSGNFNGNNHTITVSRFGAATYGGLFAKMSGTVENLKVITDNSTFGGFTYFGTVAGSCIGKIKNCNVRGIISVSSSSSEKYYGGIAGICKGEISNCSSDIDFTASLRDYYSYSSISGASSGRAIVHFGGICGNLKGKISGCNSTNILTISFNGTRQDPIMYYGGIASDIETSSIIENSYNLTSIDTISGSGYYFHAGIAYENLGSITNCYAVSESPANADYIYGIASGGTIANCFYDKDISKQTSTEYGTPKSTLAMKMKATYKNWDFENTWGIDENINDGYPYLLFQLDSIENNISYDLATQTANISIKESGTYSVIFADYENDVLENIEIKNIELNMGDNEIPTSLSLEESDKVYLWKNLISINPLCQATIIEN